MLWKKDFMLSKKVNVQENVRSFSVKHYLIIPKKLNTDMKITALKAEFENNISKIQGKSN